MLTGFLFNRYAHTYTDQGRVDVFYGSAAGIDSTTPSGWHYYGHSRMELFGYRVEGMGDLNRDGVGDFAVGAPFFSQDPDNGAIHHGRVYRCARARTSHPQTR